MERKPKTEPRDDRSTSRDRHHGGQEPPDELQDTPRQNAGYDRAVKDGPPLDTHNPMNVDDIAETPPDRRRPE